MIIHHGTTLQRAESIIQNGPDVHFQEPGGLMPAEGFSCTIPGEIEPLLSAADYAYGKSRLFPDEGGPIIIELDVPEDVIEKAESPWLPRSGGVIQFDPDNGLEELLDMWNNISKRLISVSNS